MPVGFNQGISLSNIQKQKQNQTLALSLTPIMRQRIEILQISSAELIKKIRTEVDTNPALEIVPPSTSRLSSLEKIERKNLNEEGREYFLQNWDEYDTPRQKTKEATEKRDYFFNSIQDKNCLYDLIHAQIEIQNFSPKNKIIANHIIGNIDKFGYLHETPEELLSEISEKYPNITFQEQEITHIISIIRTFDPPGFAASNIKEALLPQLQDSTSKLKPIAEKILTLNLQDTTTEKIASTLNLSEEETTQTIELLKSLNINPTQDYITDDADYISVEIIVYYDRYGKLVTKLYDEDIPQMRISAEYKEYLKTEAKDFVQNQINLGEEFINAIKDRKTTLLTIAKTMVDYQQDYFKKGAIALRPLKMSDIAKEVGLSESTVSRTIAEKYIKTPMGTIKLSTLLSRGITTQDGASITIDNTKAIIQNLIASEDKNKPLSDQDIAANLQEKGIKISRRTVVKYRDQLHIPSSNERKANAKN